MFEARHSVVVDAPLADVFAFMDEPANQLAITPSLTRAETIGYLPNGGKRVGYAYTVAGVDLTGHLEAVEYEPESRIRWEMTGDVAGEIRWRFEALDGRTRFTYAAVYDFPLGPLGPLLRPVVAWYNRWELRRTLENLRARVAPDGER